MTINLNIDQQRIVDQAIASGLIHAADDVAELGVAAIRQRLQALQFSLGVTDTEEWYRELIVWSEGHTPTPLLSDEVV